MVTIRLTGGIGNQLFQYALGLQLQEIYQKEVQFDTSFYNENGNGNATIRNMDIEAFKLVSFTKNSSATIINKSIPAKAQRFLERRFVPYYLQSYIKERVLKFDSNIFKIKNKVYLDGYWQSPKYFEGIEVALRNQLVLKDKLTGYAVELNNLLQKMNNTISIHIRRNDYLNKYSHVYYCQPLSYYQNAVVALQDRLKTTDMTLIIFSDDIEWCKLNMNFDCKTVFVDSNDRPSYEDMILMSYCNHHIIANSTYSWWGAWLNNSASKIIVAPNNWFVDPVKNELYVQSIIPSSWIRL